MTEKKQLELQDAISFSILLVFLLQAITTLVESIYMQDLLNLELDEKVLGLLFFFSPVFLYFVKRQWVLQIEKVTALLLILTRIVYPFFPTETKLLVAGLCVAIGLIFLLSHIVKHQHHMGNFVHFGISIGLSFLVMTLLKAVNSGLDISEIAKFQFITIILAIYPLFRYLKIGISNYELMESEDTKNVFNPVLGIFGVLNLAYFAFASPIVIVRWSEVNYFVLTLIYAIVLGVSIYIYFNKPRIFLLMKKKFLVIGNIIFMIALWFSIFLNQSTFISTSGQFEIIGKSSIISQISVYLMLVFSPILLLDMSQFSSNLSNRSTSLKGFVNAFLIGGFLTIIFTFMLIFSNVWGYVEPVSPYFRGLMWLPHILILILLILFTSKLEMNSFFAVSANKNAKLLSNILIVFLVISSIASVGILSSINPPEDLDNTLTIMTYNIQQGVDANGQKNYENQLRVIQDSNADIIGLQESDTSKINTGNSDVVRYFAENLGFYSYYGPKTVMQTYGVALLSRYPITFTETFFSLGDEDEIGSLHATITYNEVDIDVFVNHPAGSSDSKLDHTISMLELARNKENVVLMGDFNWRSDSVFYTMITEDYVDTWLSLYPNAVDNNGLNMTRRIDHIFVSTDFNILDGNYIESPASETDHPVYWTELRLL